MFFSMFTNELNKKGTKTHSDRAFITNVFTNILPKVGFIRFFVKQYEITINIILLKT